MWDCSIRRPLLDAWCAPHQNAKQWSWCSLPAHALGSTHQAFSAAAQEHCCTRKQALSTWRALVCAPCAQMRHFMESNETMGCCTAGKAVQLHAMCQCQCRDAMPASGSTGPVPALEPSRAVLGVESGARPREAARCRSLSLHCALSSACVKPVPRAKPADRQQAAQSVPSPQARAAPGTRAGDPLRACDANLRPFGTSPGTILSAAARLPQLANQRLWVRMHVHMLTAVPALTAPHRPPRSSRHHNLLQRSSYLPAQECGQDTAMLHSCAGEPQRCRTQWHPAQQRALCAALNAALPSVHSQRCWKACNAAAMPGSGKLDQEAAAPESQQPPGGAMRRPALLLLTDLPRLRRCPASPACNSLPASGEPAAALPRRRPGAASRAAPGLHCFGSPALPVPSLPALPPDDPTTKSKKQNNTAPCLLMFSRDMRWPSGLLTTRSAS